MQTNAQEQVRIQHGLQCPECFGVHISARDDRQFGGTKGWQCEDCGCQFSPPITRKG